MCLACTRERSDRASRVIHSPVHPPRPPSLSFSLSIDRSPIYCSLQILTVLLSIGEEGDGNVFPLYLAVLSLRATQIFPSLRIHYIFSLLSSFLFFLQRSLDWILLYSFFFFFETWLCSLSLGWSHRVDTFDLCSLIATFHSFNPITVVRYSFNRRYDYENSLFFFLGFVNIERFVQKGVVKRNWRMVKRSGEAWLAYKKRRTEV